MSTMAIPERTTDQRMEALRVANEVRIARAHAKRALRANPESVIGMIENPPPYLATMRVRDLLMAAPKVGRVRVWRWLMQCRIGETKTVSGISERQRCELLAALRVWLAR